MTWLFVCFFMAMITLSVLMVAGGIYQACTTDEEGWMFGAFFGLALTIVFICCLASVPVHLH